MSHRDDAIKVEGDGGNWARRLCTRQLQWATVNPSASSPAPIACESYGADSTVRWRTSIRCIQDPGNGNGNSPTHESWDKNKAIFAIAHFGYRLTSFEFPSLSPRRRVNLWETGGLPVHRRIVSTAICNSARDNLADTDAPRAPCLAFQIPGFG